MSVFNIILNPLVDRVCCVPECGKHFMGSRTKHQMCPECRNGEPGRQRHREASARQWARKKARRARA